MHKPNFDFAIAKNTPVLTDLTMTNGRLAVAGLGATIPVRNITSVTKTVYAAGTANVKTLDFAGVTVAENTEYVLTLQRVLHAALPLTYVIRSGATTADIRTAFVNAIASNPASFVTAAAGGGSTMVLTMVDLDSGFAVNAMPTGTTVADTTPYVAPSGTFSIVKLFDPINAVSTGNYATYKINYKEQIRHNAVGGSIVHNDRVAYIFAEQTAAGFAIFDARLMNALATITDDIALLDGAIAGVFRQMNTTAVIPISTGIIWSDATAGAVALTLPLAADFGKNRVLIVRKSVASGNALTVVRAGADTINGATSITIANGETAIIMCNGVDVYLAMIA